MPERTEVTAIVLAFNRADEVDNTLDRLAGSGVDEVIVVDSGSDDTADRVRARDDGTRLIKAENIGAAARNIGAEAARGELLLLLDDDSYPLPGAVDTLREAFERQPRLAVAGGLVRDVDEAGTVLKEAEIGTFDWFLRAGHEGPVPPEGVPTFFFPEGACMVRRDAFLEVGGFFAPYFFATSEVDVTTRLIKHGWDVRYLPAAVFEHRKAPGSRVPERMYRLRVRNQLWYFWLRFPRALALRRIPAYLLFDLIECTYHGVPQSWWNGIREAWTKRDQVRQYRDPLSREQVRRAEMNRGRLHVQLLAGQLGKRLPGAARGAR